MGSCTGYCFVKVEVWGRIVRYWRGTSGLCNLVLRGQKVDQILGICDGSVLGVTSERARRQVASSDVTFEVANH